MSAYRSGAPRLTPASRSNGWTVTSQLDRFCHTSEWPVNQESTLRNRIGSQKKAVARRFFNGGAGAGPLQSRREIPPVTTDTEFPREFLPLSISSQSREAGM
jgi:hypothetical protein